MFPFPPSTGEEKDFPRGTFTLPRFDIEVEKPGRWKYWITRPESWENFIFMYLSIVRLERPLDPELDPWMRLDVGQLGESLDFQNHRKYRLDNWSVYWYLD